MCPAPMMPSRSSDIVVLHLFLSDFEKIRQLIGENPSGPDDWIMSVNEDTSEKGLDYITNSTFENMENQNIKLKNL